MIIIDVCLSDLPKNKITKGNNGKQYIKLIVADRKAADNYGNDKMIYVSQTQEERKAQAPRTFVGAGKTYKPVETVNAEEIEANASNNNDLPF